MNEYRIIDLLQDVISGEWGKEPDGENDIFVIRTTNFTNEGKLDFDKEVVKRKIESIKVQKKKLLYGDIIIEKSGGSPEQPVGRVVYFGLPKEEKIYLCNNFTSILRPNDLVDSKFLFYCLLYYYNQKAVLKFQNKTTGIINLKLTNYLESIKVILPSLEEQKRIAAVLEKAQALIDKRKEAIAKLDELVQAVFLDMFGDLQNNPKNWPIENFSYFAKIDTNMVHDFTKYQHLPHIGIDCIEKNTGELSGYKLVGEENLTSGKYIFSEKHIIYSKIRPYLNKVALPNFSGLCSADAYPILVDNRRANRYFYAFILRSQIFLNHVANLSNRTNIPKVNKAQLESFSCIAPPIEKQEEFKKAFLSIEAHKEKQLESLKELKITFNSLLQHAFKGELKFKEEIVQ